MVQQKESVGNERLQFMMYNIIRQLQSWVNADLVMRDINAANNPIPTRQQIEEDLTLRKLTGKNILVYKSNVVDSKEYWYSVKKEMLGAMR